jgi:glycosyltransferase involved in cell wall biosynthesis
MIHVCFVSPKIHNFLATGEPSGAGGAERQQYLLGTELIARGHQVSLVTRNFDGGESHERIEDFDVWKTIPDVRGVGNAPVKALRVLRTLRRVGADVYYVRGNDFLCMVTSAYCRLSSSRFVYAVSSDADIEPEHLSKYHPFRRRAFLAAVRNADRVVAQTDHQWEVLRVEHGVSAAIIGNGYDIPDADELLSPDDREFVLWVGRMDSEQKKPERFFRLARALPDHQFVMVGPPNDDEPAYFERLETEAHDIPNLRFEGLVEPDEIDEYFRHASILVNTSEYEGLPNVFLEAWRYATPVVSLHYTFDGKFDGSDIGVHSGSMDSLVADVERLLRDGEERRRIGSAGRTHLQDNHSMKAIADEYETLFDRIAGHT